MSKKYYLLTYLLTYTVYLYTEDEVKKPKKVKEEKWKIKKKSRRRRKKKKKRVMAVKKEPGPAIIAKLYLADNGIDGFHTSSTNNRAALIHCLRLCTVSVCYLLQLLLLMTLMMIMMMMNV